MAILHSGDFYLKTRSLTYSSSCAYLSSVLWLLSVILMAEEGLGLAFSIIEKSIFFLFWKGL